MGKEILHAIDIRNVIIKSLFGLMFGIVLLLVPISLLVQLIIVIIGLLMIVVNGYSVYVEVNENSNSSELLYSILSVLFGFILICFPSTLITIVVSIYLIAIPLFSVYKDKFNKQSVLEKLPVMVLGIILLVAGVSTFDPLFKVLGLIVSLASILYLGYNYYLYRQSGVKIVK